MGSTIRMTKENGDTIAWADYDAWGKPLSPKDFDINMAGVDNAVGFTSYTYDVVLDLYFAQARFYDQNDRRFISVDPIKDGINWYAYCGNNPIRYTDSNGLYYLERDEFGQVYAVIEKGDTMSGISCSEVQNSNAYLSLGYAEPDAIKPGQRVNITGIYNSSHPIPTDIKLSKLRHTQGDSGLRNIPDDEIARRARDKSLSGEERRRYQTEEKLRGQRNKQKRESTFQDEYARQLPSVFPSLSTNNQYTNLPVVDMPSDTFWKGVEDKNNYSHYRTGWDNHFR